MVKQMTDEAIRQEYAAAPKGREAEAFRSIIKATGYTAKEVRDILLKDKVVTAGRATGYVDE